jgi:hypothetical protein
MTVPAIRKIATPAATFVFSGRNLKEKRLSAPNVYSVNCRALAAAPLIILLAASATPAFAAGCVGLANGAAVALKSSDIDPDVFVWDSKAHVIVYSSGVWNTTSEVMSHTMLSKPGTRAKVVSCEKQSVKSKYVNNVLDAVGIQLTDGPNRGRYGWVTSEDVHIMPPRGGSTALSR